MIKLTRLSDNKEFLIDDESQEWKATKIEGIDALSPNVYTEALAMGMGEVVTGKYTGRRDITVTAHRPSQENISESRSRVLEFFDPESAYQAKITYNGKTLYIDCELLNYSLPSDNIYKPLDLTFTMLCPAPYFNSGNKTLPFNAGQRLKVGGQVNINPTVVITLRRETEFYIYIGNNDPIHVILPDNFFPSHNTPPYTLELDCRYGILKQLASTTNLTADLTRYIVNGNPLLSLTPDKDYGVIRFLSNTRHKESGTATISTSYFASVTTSYKIRELTITFSDGHKSTYGYSDNPVKYNNYQIDFTDSGFIIHGPSKAVISYTALIEDTSPNQSSAVIKYKDLYRGF